MTPNLKAFLAAIAASEGTGPLGQSGYDVLVGSLPNQVLTFSSFADHPRTAIQLRPGLVSTAAGRYQILERYFDAYKASLHLPDFSPASQDAIAVQMLTEVDALTDIAAGNFASAAAKAASRWASFPDSQYGQHTNSLSMLEQAYTAAGGTLV
jgi:muramidase (phage lysozyme)